MRLDVLLEWRRLPSVASHLEVNVNVISKDVHAEEPAAADLAGVLLITVSQQMLVHVASAGEDLHAHTHTHTPMSQAPAPALNQSGSVFAAHFSTDGTRRRLLPVLGAFFSIGLQLLSLHVLRSCRDASWV